MIEKLTTCLFCDIANGGLDNLGRRPPILYEEKDFICTADVGAIGEGHVLISSKRHVNSMAELTQDEHIGFWGAQKIMEAGLKAIYGKNCVRFEHGSGLGGGEGAASTVKHAHFHMVPIDRFDDEIHLRILDELKMREVDDQYYLNLSRYIRDNPYVYYVDGDGRHYVSGQTVFEEYFGDQKKPVENQYMRQRIADQFKRPYNWREPANLEVFKQNAFALERKWQEATENIEDSAGSKYLRLLKHFRKLQGNEKTC